MKDSNSKENQKEMKQEPKNDKAEEKKVNDMKILNKKTNRSKDKIDLGNLIEQSNNQKLNNNSNQLNIIFCKDLIKDSFFNDEGIDNMFIVFKAINDILYIIYANEYESIIIFNFIDNKKINEIKNAHSYPINNFRHFLDKNNKRDLVLSISSFDNNIKIWNFNNLECLLNIKKVYNKGVIFSACFFYNNSQIYIVSCNDYYPDKPGPIKVFNFQGKKIKEINNSKERSFFIDIYYDHKYDNNYVLVANKFYVKSYDYFRDKLYHKYCDDSLTYHSCIIINNGENDNITKLIESSNDGNIRIWNFHSGELLKRIKIHSNKEQFAIYGISLLRGKYLIVGCNDMTIKLLDINNSEVVQCLHGHSEFPSTVKIVNHPFYGECLISKGGKNDLIKLWLIKNKK